MHVLPEVLCYTCVGGSDVRKSEVYQSIKAEPVPTCETTMSILLDQNDYKLISTVVLLVNMEIQAIATTYVSLKKVK